MNATATVASTTLPTAALNNNFRVSAFQVSANTNYKVTVEAVVVTWHTATTYTLNSPYNIQVDVLNRASGQFDFRFVSASGVPLTNTVLSNTTDIYMNIKISE